MVGFKMTIFTDEKEMRLNGRNSQMEKTGLSKAKH